MVERVSKITTQCGYRGPVTERMVIGLVMCFIDSAVEEFGEKGKYVRLIGQFAGRFMLSPETREIADYAAAECILPKLGGQWIASLLERQEGPRSTDETSKATGTVWRPKNGIMGMQAKLQLGLKPPLPGKPSQTGYEYWLEVLELDSRVEDPMQAALSSLGEPGTLKVKPKPAAITDEAAD